MKRARDSNFSCGGIGMYVCVCTNDEKTIQDFAAAAQLDPEELGTDRAAGERKCIFFFSPNFQLMFGNCQKKKEEKERKKDRKMKKKKKKIGRRSKRNQKMGR